MKNVIVCAGDSFRILAATNNTELTINGVFATNLTAGIPYDTILVGPVVFQGSNPIQVAQFAQGGGTDTNNWGYGDPCEILLPSTGQYLTSYIVATGPGAPLADLTNNFLNLIVPQSAISTTMVDCSVVASTNFTSIPTTGYYAARVWVTNGVHTINSSQPVEVEVYGFGQWDAYGYIGGVTSFP